MYVCTVPYTVIVYSMCIHTVRVYKCMTYEYARMYVYMYMQHVCTYVRMYI